MMEILGYDDVTYWALAAVARVRDAHAAGYELPFAVAEIATDPLFRPALDAVPEFERRHRQGIGGPATLLTRSPS